VKDKDFSIGLVLLALTLLGLKSSATFFSIKKRIYASF